MFIMKLSGLQKLFYGVLNIISTKNKTLQLRGIYIVVYKFYIYRESTIIYIIHIV